MERLKEAILKLSNSGPNGPLTKTQNSILQQRLTQFLSSCLHTTPDHPPYAWMIQKALQELDEEGGSSENSISEFIKKEYHDNLPWAHVTLLKHHLQKLSEDGDILMVDDGERRFLLAGSESSSNPKRKSRRKKRWDRETKQKRKKRRVLQHDDDAQVVKEQKKLDEQQNEVVAVNGNHGQQNGLSTDKEDWQLNHVTGNNMLPGRGVQRIRIIHKQKEKQQQPDATEGPLLQSSIASESDVGSYAAGLVPIEHPRFMLTEKETEHLEDLGLLHQKVSLSSVEEETTADICNLYQQKNPENNEQPGDNNLPQILSPEVPPGFEYTMVEGASANKAHNSSSSVGLEDHVVHQNPERPAEDQAPRMDGLSDALEQQHQDGSGHTKDGSTPSAAVLSLNQNQQQSSLDTERLENEIVADDLLKNLKQQKKHRGWQQMKRPSQALNIVQREGTVTPNAPLPLTLQSQHQEQQISDGDRKQVQPAVESSSEPKQLSVQRRWTRTQLKGIITQPASSTDLFALKHVEQDNVSESKQQVDIHGDLEKGEAKQLTALSKMEVEIHGDLEKGEAKQLTELSKMEGSQETVPATDEPSGEKHQQPQEGRSTSKKLNEDDEPGSLLLRKPTGSEAVTIDKPSDTDRAQRQLKRWSRDRCEPKPVSTSKVEPLQFGASADRHLLQIEEPLALATSEEAWNFTDPQREVHLERQKHQHRGRTPKYKEDGTKLGTGSISALATGEEALNLTDPQNEVHSEQPKHQRRGRTPKYKEDGAKLGTSSSSALATREVALNLTNPRHEVHSERQNYQLCGRPPMYRDEAKLGTSTIPALATGEEALNLIDPQHEVRSERQNYQLRGRPSNYEDGVAKLGTRTISPMTASEEVLRLNDEVHPNQEKHRRFGRPPKRKDGGKRGTTILKNLGLSKKLKGETEWSGKA